MTFIETGESVVADMLDDDAPGVCELIWSRLPLEHNLIHGIYSGAEVFAMIDSPAAAQPENMVQLPLPGELLYFYEEGRGAVGARKPVGEICIVYGRGVVLRGHEGVTVHANLFARIPGDWMHDWPEFAVACRKVRWEGPKRLRFDRA